MFILFVCPTIGWIQLIFHTENCRSEQEVLLNLQHHKIKKNKTDKFCPKQTNKQTSGSSNTRVSALDDRSGVLQSGTSELLMWLDSLLLQQSANHSCSLSRCTSWQDFCSEKKQSEGAELSRGRPEVQHLFRHLSSYLTRWVRMLSFCCCSINTRSKQTLFE